MQRKAQRLTEIATKPSCLVAKTVFTAVCGLKQRVRGEQLDVEGWEVEATGGVTWEVLLRPHKRIRPIITRRQRRTMMTIHATEWVTLRTHFMLI